MLRSRVLGVLLAICLTVTASVAIARVDGDGQTNNRLRDIDTQVDGGGGGGIVRPQPDPEPQPEEPTTPAPVVPTPIVVPQDAPTVGNLVQNTTNAGTRVIQSAANALRDLVPSRGGRLNALDVDVLVNDYPDECRWLDNTDPQNDYFVPISTIAEWTAFINGVPSVVTRTTCCPATSVTLTASDGQFMTLQLPIGREGSDGPNGSIDVAHNFGLTRALDGATWVEQVTDTLRCVDGAWASTAFNRQGDEPPVEPGPDPDPGLTAPTCQTGFESASTFEGESEGTDTDNTYPVSANARVYYTMDNQMSIRVNGVLHPMVNVQRVGNSLYGEYLSPTFTVATRVRNMHQAYRYVTWGGRTCNPVPVENAVVMLTPDCRAQSGTNYGACQWSSNGDDLRDVAPNNRTWHNVMFACARAGYKYMVAGAGSDYDDCSGCSWVQWVNNGVSGNPSATMLSTELPAANAPGRWTPNPRRSWTNAGGLRKVWCSNLPDQHVPFDCQGGDVVVNTAKAVRTGNGRFGSQTTNVPATFTATLPDGYIPHRASWEVWTPVHPDDAGTTPSTRRNDAHLRLISGVLQPQGQPAENVKRYAECTASGWRVYGSCQSAGIKGMGGLGTNFGRPGSATCSDAPPMTEIK